MRVHAAPDSDAPVTEGAGASPLPLLSGALKSRALHLAGALTEILRPAPDAGYRDASLSFGYAGLAVCDAQLARTRHDRRAADTALGRLEEAIDVLATEPLTSSLPGPATVRIDAYLARRADLAGAKSRPGRPEPGHGANVLFATGSGRRLFAAGVWRVMRRLAARAGLPEDLTGRVGPEAMRHSFATLYLDAGGSLSELQEVMGHADPRTTRRYDRERQAPRQSPGDLVAAYLSTPPRPRM
jgi:integrase